MKSKIIILLIVLRSGIGVYAQDCPGAPLTLSTQAQVDNFPNNFPGCTEVGVTITISGNNITNLNGLSQIESITKSLLIINNPALTSLTGLSNLSNIGVELTIENCDALANLNGLENLPFIGGTLTITGNAVLNSLSALSGLGYINGSLLISQNPVLPDLTGLDNIAFTGRFLQISSNNALTALNSLNAITEVGNNPNTNGRFLSIGSNPNLTTLNGLNNLVSVGTLFEIANNNNLASLNAFNSLTTVGEEFSITNNPDLTSIVDFESLNSVGGTITISNNASLSNCAALGICQLVGPPGQQANIINNATGCDNENEVEVACAAAPVELTFFKGKYEDEAAVLTWQTATEKNNDYFNVEHSINGNHFQKLDKVAGHGSSSDVNNYQFRHMQPSKGAHYYRLKQVDFDGTSQYSNIAVVFSTGDDAVNIAPNPFTDVVFIQGITDECVVRVRSASGMGILEKNISANCPLDLSGAPNGIYFVEIQTDSQRTVKRMIKE
ncbi:MAG: T9SS C-terminal target domain-containing protein [Haliscomenobacteraceae bacterium CHB4]|nr:T9SS C-terminal target domain-containing protein [Haliscomenobacteraceae bacterium CHB4]